MSQLIKISNETLKVSISTLGAELTSVIKNGKEMMWDANPDVWGFHAPILFPICGAVKDDKYILDGKEYTLEKHGFARASEFEVENVSENQAVFLLKSTPETLKKYPYDFEFRVIFTLKDNQLKVEYKITNLTDKTMYSAAGGHEAFACPEGVEAYSVIFEQEEDLDANIIEGGYVSKKTKCLGKGVKELPLKDEYFEIDAIPLFSLKSRKVTLKNTITGECISLDFEGNNYFLIWTKYKAKYVCLEAWSSAPDFSDSGHDFTKKDGILVIPPHESETKQHTITF